MKRTVYKSYDELPLMLSVPEVAAVLGISRAGTYELVKSAGFPSLKSEAGLLSRRRNSLRGSMRRQQVVDVRHIRYTRRREKALTNTGRRRSASAERRPSCSV